MVCLRVMLTTNVDVSDGLVNGARGEIVHIVTNSSNEVTNVLVKFDIYKLASLVSIVQGTLMLFH